MKYATWLFGLFLISCGGPQQVTGVNASTATTRSASSGSLTVTSLSQCENGTSGAPLCIEYHRKLQVLLLQVYTQVSEGRLTLDAAQIFAANLESTFNLDDETKQAIDNELRALAGR